jgi:CubicO group peptidase (beta-lactamase class C family)
VVHDPPVDVPRSSPSAQGVDPAGVAALVDALDGDERLEPHGLIVQRHGVRVVEAAWAPHAIDRSRLVYSLSKTFTGTALGLQLGEGRLSLDDLVSDHLPDLFDDVDERTRRLRIRHIASMATGHDRETALEAFALDPDDPVRGFLRIPPDHEPGTVFAYNQPPVLTLATILQRRSRQRLSEYLRPRLLDPIGIGELSWVELRPGIEMAYSGVYTSLDAVARLGQLHLDGGTWAGRRVLPATWVAEASKPQVANPGEPQPDWQQGYGFQLWMSRHGYRGDGAFGQYMLVLPQQDAVVAIFSGNEDMQALLDHVWAHLLPALRPDPVPGGDGDEALAARLAALRVPTPADRIGGVAPGPRSVTFTPGAPGERSHRSITSLAVADGELVVREDDASFAVPLRTAWSEGRTGHVAASAAQGRDGRLHVDLAFLHTPHRLELVLDASTGTFTADWPAVPLFRAGLRYRLSELRPPVRPPSARP